MRYLIDTNVVSEVRKGARCDAHVASWYASLSDEDLYMSVLVTGEIRKGVVADAWGRMNAVRPVPVIDGLLAASAVVFGLTLATRNASDVAGLGAPVINPFGTTG